jgi:starch synthase
MATLTMTPRPTVAIFPWGDVLEDFLEPIGLDVRDFAERMSGGWLFGYVAALQLAGWRPIIIGASNKCSTTIKIAHRATGALICLVPGRSTQVGRSSSLYSLRRWLAEPVSAFGRVLDEEQCRAVIVQEYEYTRFDQLVRLGHSRDIPVFASFQGGDQTLSRVEALVRRSSLRKCAGLIIASSAERNRVVQQYRQCHPPIASIPNPVDTGEWRSSDRLKSRRELGIHSNSFVVVSHGRIDIHRKGLDVLLEAWARCKEGRLVIIGSGQDNDLFREMVKKSCYPPVQWLSDYTTDRAFLRAWLSAADLYVMASRVEGMPVAPLEAMACGLPVVATDAQGLPDIFIYGEQSGGLIVARDDASSLAAGIEKLRCEPEFRRKLGKAARARVEANFSIQAIAKQLGDFLGERGQ